MVAGEAPVSLLTALLWYRRLGAGILLGATVLGAGAGLVLQPPPTATAQIAVLDPRGNTVLRQGVTSEASFATYTEQRAVFVRSTDVLALASSRLAADGLNVGVEQLRGEVGATATDVGALIDITVTADSAGVAVRIADAVVTAYRELTRRDLQAQVAAQARAVGEAIEALRRTARSAASGSVPANAAAATIAGLQTRAANAAIDISSAADGTRFVVAARAQPSGAIRSVTRGAGTGAAAGLLVTIMLGYALADRVPLAGPGGRDPRGASLPEPGPRDAGAREPGLWDAGPREPGLRDAGPREPGPPGSGAGDDHPVPFLALVGEGGPGPDRSWMSSRIGEPSTRRRGEGLR